MTLTAHHYAMLHTASAITDAVIQARGYTSLDHPDEVRDLGFTKAQARTAPVLAIPLWDVHGQQTGWQIRPESPRQMKDGKIFKYETMKGGRLQLDVHPSVQPLLGDPHVALWITEGVRKGDALVSAGAPCVIALMGGVHGYRGTNEHGGKVILPDWEHVALNGRTVYVAYDSDLASKPGVQGALKGLWTYLRSKQALPARVDWPGEYQQTKWGVDDFLADNNTLDDLLAMVPPIGPLPTAPPHGQGPPSWQDQLLLTPKRIPQETISNVLLMLENHEHWTGKLWFDAVRVQPMLEDVPIDEQVLVEIARWCSLQYRMPVNALRRLEHCVRTVCHKHARDLLAEWLLALPPWDQVTRLTAWLEDVASVPKTAYSMELARLIPVSMVARALKPGCQYRYVIILEGAEDSGKSKLVRTLASPEWYREFAVSMANKEAHMLLQGAWVAELGELASLNRTKEEAKLKSFITLEEDVWIPKYSNFVYHAPRRTIFIGTVNPEDEYLKGQTGNTRFLPIKTGVIDCALLDGMREQLLAEALVYYKDHPEDWWQLSAEAEREAQVQREARRQPSVFEDDLADWLENRRHDEQNPVHDRLGRMGTFIRGETTWEEIAQYYLQIAQEQWKDKALQMQIAQALRARGWEKMQDRQRGTKQRYWRQRVSPPPEGGDR